MRRFTAAFVALATALGLALVAAPALASITAPGNGATVAGNITVSDSGASNSGNFYCGDGNMYTRVNLVNSSNQVVEQLINLSGSSAGGSKSATLVTRNHPNGSYTLSSSVRNVVKSGFGGLGCGTSTSNTSRSIVIANTVDLAVSGDFSVPANTTTPITVSVVDANVSGVAVAGAPVTVSLTGGGSASGTTNGAGNVTVNLPVAGPPRNATLTVTMTGTSYYQASSLTRGFVVEQNPTTTTLVQPAPVVHGEATSFTATVARASGSGTPTGFVQFIVDGANFGAPVALSSGSATSLSTSSLSTGQHTVVASYGGDANFKASTSSPKVQVVNKAATVTSLSAAPTPTVSGQAVTFTAHVDVQAPGAGVLGGAVQFNIDGQPFGTAVPLGAGDNATLTVSSLSTGNHDVEAVYNGTADFAQSSSAVVTHGVNRADTTVALTSSANPAVSGQALTYTAVVTPVAPGAGTITGTVQFAVDGVDLGAPVPVSGGQATSPVTNQLVGNHTVTANYSGDANFGGESDQLTQVVVAAQTTTTVSSSPNPSVFGQPVTLHAEVVPNAPATGNPTGFVQFIVDGANYAFVELNGQVAETVLSGVGVGPHTVRAVYLSNDLNFFTSSSATITQQVNKASTQTVVTSSAPSAVFGQPVTFTAEVSVLAPGAGSPSGTIVFKDGTTVIGTEPVSSSTGGQASITISSLAVGQHAISATYSGDDSFNGSAGNASQTVTRAQTSTVIASSANPSQSGQGVQFTATVSPVAPGAGNPTGTVRFFVNGANLGSPAPVVNGVATSPNFASLTPGVYKISATYNGDGNFVGSTGYLDQGSGQNVTKGQTSMSVDSGPNPSAYGAPVTITTTVSAVAPAQRKPSGVVQIWEDDVLLGATSLVPGSAANAATATFVTTSLSAGTHALTAVYVGNFNFDPNTASFSQVVGQVPTVTGLSSSLNPAVYGDTVTLTATVGSSGGTPTGTVTFTEGSTVLGSAPIGTTGGQQQASLAVPGLHAGSHAITAVYSGDVSHGSSTSPAYSQVITKAPTTIVAADVNNPGPLAPRANWIRAKLTDRYGNPMEGRSISFDAPPGDARPSRHLCDAVTNAQGIAECNDQVISIDISLFPGETLLDIHGTYDVTYVGDADTIGSTARGHEY